MSVSTIERVRQLFVEEGLDAALNRKPPRRQYVRRLDGEQEAHLIALFCSQAPEGHNRRTLRLLVNKMVQLEYVDSVSHETVRQVLKNALKPWLKEERRLPRRPTPSLSAAWRIRWSCIRRKKTRATRWSVWTKRPNS